MITFKDEASTPSPTLQNSSKGINKESNAVPKNSRENISTEEFIMDKISNTKLRRSVMYVPGKIATLS
jgi:hypothetical protein